MAQYLRDEANMLEDAGPVGIPPQILDPYGAALTSLLQPRPTHVTAAAASAASLLTAVYGLTAVIDDELTQQMGAAADAGTISSANEAVGSLTSTTDWEAALLLRLPPVSTADGAAAVVVQTHVAVTALRVTAPAILLPASAGTAGLLPGQSLLRVSVRLDVTAPSAVPAQANSGSHGGGSGGALDAVSGLAAAKEVASALAAWRTSAASNVTRNAISSSAASSASGASSSEVLAALEGLCIPSAMHLTVLAEALVAYEVPLSVAGRTAYLQTCTWAAGWGASRAIASGDNSSSSSGTPFLMSRAIAASAVTASSPQQAAPLPRPPVGLAASQGMAPTAVVACEVSDVALPVAPLADGDSSSGSSRLTLLQPPAALLNSSSPAAILYARWEESVPESVLLPSGIVSHSNSSSSNTSTLVNVAPRSMALAERYVGAVEARVGALRVDVPAVLLPEQLLPPGQSLLLVSLRLWPDLGAAAAAAGAARSGSAAGEEALEVVSGVAAAGAVAEALQVWRNVTAAANGSLVTATAAAALAAAGLCLPPAEQLAVIVEAQAAAVASTLAATDAALGMTGVSLCRVVDVWPGVTGLPIDPGSIWAPFDTDKPLTAAPTPDGSAAPAESDDSTVATQLSSPGVIIAFTFAAIILPLAAAHSPPPPERLFYTYIGGRAKMTDLGSNTCDSPAAAAAAAASSPFGGDRGLGGRKSMGLRRSMSTAVTSSLMASASHALQQSSSGRAQDGAPEQRMRRSDSGPGGGGGVLESLMATAGRRLGGLARSRSARLRQPKEYLSSVMELGSGVTGLTIPVPEEDSDAAGSDIEHGALPTMAAPHATADGSGELDGPQQLQAPAAPLPWAGVGPGAGTMLRGVASPFGKAAAGKGFDRAGGGLGIARAELCLLVLMLVRTITG
eukprot:XP_001701072.1 predicted protein [Chlamydomonas reinhardtii]